MNDTIGVVGGIFGILGISLFSIYKWLQAHTIVLVKHKLNSTIDSGHLSEIDVRNGINFIADDARNYSPDCIYGINRGGAIVGGMLAKKLGSEVHLLQVNCDWSEGRRVLECRTIGPHSPRRILLVDDAKRKGEHMREAVAYMKWKYPHSTVRRAVILEMTPGQHRGLETTTFREYGADVVAFHTNNIKVSLPWD